MNNPILKKLLPYGVAIVAFVVFAILYCSPELNGKVLQQGDIVSWKSMYQEVKLYNDQGEYDIFWTGSMFSGMPNYQIGGGRTAKSYLYSTASDATKLFTTGAIAFLISYLLGFFILLRSFKVDTWMSIFGAMVIALSSYFLIIIEAGHETKALALGRLAAIIGGFRFIYDKRYLLGAILVMLYSALAVMLHPQMTLYLFMLIGIFFFTELFIHIKENRIWKDFVVGSAIFVGSVFVGLGANYTTMRLNSEYAKETMRGGHSELAKDSDAENKTAGLDLDYATQWSYGIRETMTLFIPNYMGASSHYNVGKDSEIYKAFTANGFPARQAENYCKTMPTYWGTQPFTSGPVYVGAIVFFLFILGLIIVKGPYKWALLIATLFSIALAWGKNFMPLTELFFNYFPMYNKFRAVSSILVVAEITIPLLALLAIKTIMEKGIDKKALNRAIYISGGAVGVVLLGITLFAGGFNFVSPNDAQMAGSYPDWLMTAIRAERASMLRADALRSLIYILLSAGVLWLFVQEKLKSTIFIVLIGSLMVIDLWAVDKRFFNDDSFVEERNYTQQFAKQPWEVMLEQDNDSHFRILNTTTSTFNDSRSSYYYKSIGGYHAAKLRRYQDLIDQHIARNNMSVLNMLNAKYFIVRDNNGQGVPQRNPYAMGNAWFVTDIKTAATPNEESEALYTIDVRKTAVVDTAMFGEFVNKGASVSGYDSLASVKLTSYRPNILTYEYTASKPGTIVFSEIYYPYGWKAYINDEPVEHFRANYALRALNVPAGHNTIRFEFTPDTIKKSEPIVYISSAILYVTILLAIGLGIRSLLKNRPQQK